MGSLVEAPADFFSKLDISGPLEAAVLFKRAGTQLAAWTRNPVPMEVLTVMSATLMASVDSLIEALGGANPKGFELEAGDRRFYLTKIEPHFALLLVAPKTVSDSYLSGEARRIIGKISAVRTAAGERSLPANAQPRTVRINRP